jgi:hypothetical protein
MKVRMTIDVSGTRNGQPWPPRGTVIDLPDDEALHYCEQSQAVPVVDMNVEKAVLPDDVETRALTTSTGPVKRGPGRSRKTP